MNAAKQDYRHGPEAKGVNRHLVCLTDRAEPDLKLVTGYMQVSQSEAIRQGLGLMADRVLASVEKLPAPKRKASQPK